MKQATAIAVLVLIFLSTAVPLVLWIHEDTAPPAWDQSWHAMISGDMYRQLTWRSVASTEMLEERYPIFNLKRGMYPPFVYAATVPSYTLFGMGYDAALLTNLLFLAILIGSAFLIGRSLHSDEAGLIIAFILGSAPGLIALTREYLLDFPLVAMVALGYAMLLMSDSFEDRRYALLFGIAFGLGMLTKWTYAVYIIIPTAYAAVVFLRRHLGRKTDYPAFWNLAMPLVVIIGLMLLWYTPSHLKEVVPILSFYSGTGGLEGYPSSATLAGWTHYGSVIISDYSFLFFLLFIAGIMHFILTDRRNSVLWTALCQILVAYIFFSSVSVKDPRYIMPVMVFLAVFSGIWIIRLRWKKTRLALIAVVVILGCMLSGATQHPSISTRYSAGGVPLLDLAGRYPHQGTIDFPSILRSIQQSSGGIPSTVCIIAESASLNDVNIPYFAIMGDYPIRFMLGNGCNPKAFDFSVVGPIEESWRSDTIKRSRTMLNLNLDSFREVYTSADGSIIVYKRAG
ncbi:glycosyltransferase family 39 protein [Candidatus Woesearchaeota archaeon]|nr:glycosyltransferase family 39 protein [Candidatus Woesearchaeota archaeon]